VIWNHKLLHALTKIRGNYLPQKKIKKITHWFTKSTIYREKTLSAHTDNAKHAVNNQRKWRTSKQLTRKTAMWIASIDAYRGIEKFERRLRRFEETNIQEKNSKIKLFVQ
jgi:hypothetical protein